MQTALADFIKDTPEGKEADSILRKCVHCGFCTATCPTYQLLGDELDGPRGRIYLIKQVLEGHEVTGNTQLHLDRCLTCRNCETTCPSGVKYGRLVDIGRKIVDDHVPRRPGDRLARIALKEGVTSPLFAPAMRVGKVMRPLLPRSLQNKVPRRQEAGRWPASSHQRKVLLLEGCVQPSMAPNINPATARVLDALGIETLRPAAAGCCGALRYHLNDHDGGLADARRNIDAWWPYVENAEKEGLAAIVMNASGCGVQVKEYGYLLGRDSKYANKARRISEMTRDLAEFLPSFAAKLQTKIGTRLNDKVVFHPPCTLQHGQQIHGAVEKLLASLGATVKPFAETHMCCGSAGTYSVLQPELAYQLRDRKLAHLEAARPDVILSANIGCISHLASGTKTHVMHWIEWLDERLRAT
ncbi:MAG TPA: glycolate oxidase subunit GlcF [Burkholderiaceae bacterium]|jgi:glycolate oxidase iron-sulfur subunit|nr:glycolate oxidase subunit GlcF [Burkholderiaceae bacterium]